MKKAYETAGWNRLGGEGWKIHYFKKRDLWPLCGNIGTYIEGDPRGGRKNRENFGTNFLKSLTDNMFCKSCAKKRKVPR